MARSEIPNICSKPVLLAGFLITVGLATMLGLNGLLRQNPLQSPRSIAEVLRSVEVHFRVAGKPLDEANTQPIKNGFSIACAALLPGISLVACLRACATARESTYPVDLERSVPAYADSPATLRVAARRRSSSAK